jgi:membrane protease YdiL (CAAX protease family)
MVIAAALYATLWAGAVAYLYVTNGDWETPLFVMAIFGLGLTGLGWLLTRGANAPAIPVRRPALESGALIVFLALYAIGFLGYAMTAARAAFPPGPEQELLVLGLKLLAHVMLPALILLALGAKLAPLFQAGLNGRKFWRTFIAMSVVILGVLSVISPSLQSIQQTGAAPAVLLWAAPASFAWIALEAGLCEEFLFRAVLQTRLSAWFNSPWLGVVITSVLFGLAHAPGLFLRGGPGVDGWSTDPLQVIAHTIAVLSPISLTMGVLYARTKSLLLVVLLHAMVDVMPNMAEFIGTWT